MKKKPKMDSINMHEVLMFKNTYGSQTLSLLQGCCSSVTLLSTAISVTQGYILKLLWTSVGNLGESHF